MKRNPQDLEKIAHLTLEHYNQYAEEFWQGTRDHDISQNIAALLQYIRNESPFKIPQVLGAALNLSRYQKIFLQKRLSHKATPFIGQNHFWTGFCQRGHD